MCFTGQLSCTYLVCVRHVRFISPQEFLHWHFTPPPTWFYRNLKQFLNRESLVYYNKVSIWFMSAGNLSRRKVGSDPIEDLIITVWEMRLLKAQRPSSGLLQEASRLWATSEHGNCALQTFSSFVCYYCLQKSDQMGLLFQMWCCLVRIFYHKSD